MPKALNPGRVAGLWYLFLTLLGPISLVYIPSKLFVHGNPSATANNIATHEGLFRLGMVTDLAGAVALVFLVLALYQLFKGVDNNLAVLVVIVFELCSWPLQQLSAASAIHRYARSASPRA